MPGTWTLYVRDDAYRRIAQIDDFQKLDVVQRFRDVGTWALELDARQPAAAMLSRSNYGIVLYKGSTAVVSGDVDEISGKQSLDRNRVTFSGFDDNLWLKARIGHPQPGSSTPPYNSTEHDVRTGVTSTILIAYANANLGPGAVVARRHPALTMAADPVVGLTQTGRIRWTPLLTNLQDLAISGGDLGFRVIQVGAGLQFQVYQPQDRSTSVKFSFELGNLLDASYTLKKPTATYIYAGGSGEGTARVVREGYDATGVITYRRREAFADRRDTSDTGELDQTVREQLADGAGQTGFSLTPIDTPSQEYVTHYQLGDKVTGVLNDQELVDVVRELKIGFDPSGPTRIQPLVGTTRAIHPDTTLRTFQFIGALLKRVAQIEGRR